MFVRPRSSPDDVNCNATLSLRAHPCLLVVKFEPGDGVLAQSGLQGGQGERTGQLTGPVLPPADLAQLGLPQHQRGLLG